MTDEEESVENIEEETPIVKEFLETDLTSDILIYNLLKNSDDPFIKEFNIKFIDRSVPSEESNTIYIANMELQTRKESFHNVEYTALVNIFVKTKQTNYLVGSQYLRTVVKHIKNVLKSNVTCRRRHLAVRNIQYEYGSTYTLKGLHMILQLNEMERVGTDAQIIDEVILEDLQTYVVSEDLYWREKNKQKKL